jgi:hypothetical protein
MHGSISDDGHCDGGGFSGIVLGNSKIDTSLDVKVKDFINC